MTGYKLPECSVRFDSCDIDDAPVIGIDLGTTNTCAAYWDGSEARMIQMGSSNSTMPSYVLFLGDADAGDDAVVIGTEAKNQMLHNADATVYDAKRLIGRAIDDENLQPDRMQWPFGITRGANGQILCSLKLTDKEGGHARNMQVRPVEVSAILLREVKSCAQAAVGKVVDQAVIAVPAYFNDGQRTATIDAARIAGWKVNRLVDEPTAAACAYRSSYSSGRKKNIMVFDLGGGTFDVTLLASEGNMLAELNKGGSTHLGGQDFDARLLNWALQEVQEQHGVTLPRNSEDYLRLRNTCEDAKKQLSHRTAAVIHMRQIHKAGGKDFRRRIERRDFEYLNQDLFDECLTKVDHLFKTCSSCTKDQVRDVVLMGGSTRIPKIQEMLRSYFGGGVRIHSQIHPDEGVAKGAALWAAQLTPGSSRPDIRISEITPFDIGVSIWAEGQPGIMDIIIPANSLLPACKTQIYTTQQDYIPAVSFPIFQGPHRFTKDNHRLGQIIMPSPRTAKAGVPKFEIRLEVNANNCLEVKATNLYTGESIRNTLEKRGQLTHQQVDELAARLQNWLPKQIV